MPLSAGDRLGPYEILAPIGAGGMGDVCRARDTRLDREIEQHQNIGMLQRRHRFALTREACQRLRIVG